MPSSYLRKMKFAPLVLLYAWSAYMVWDVATEIGLLVNFHPFCCWRNHFIALEMAVKSYGLHWLKHKLYCQKVVFDNGNLVKFSRIVAYHRHQSQCGRWYYICTWFHQSPPILPLDTNEKITFTPQRH